MIVASLKLERIPVAKLRNVKNYRLQGRSQERFGKLAGWLGPWEGIIKITVQIGQGLAETVLETDKIILFKLNGK